MPHMHISLPHTLGAAEALARMRQFAARLRAEHAHRISHVREQWQANTGRFHLHLMGAPVEATVTVGESEVRMQGHLPWAAALLRGRIEATIRREVAALLK